jgi:hypothetical protein
MLVVRYFPPNGGVQIFTAKDVQWVEPGADDPSAKPYILSGDSLITDGQVEVLSDQGALIYTLTLSPLADTAPKDDTTWEPGL